MNTLSNTSSHRTDDRIDVSSGEGPTELSVRTELLTEKMKVSKMQVRLNREAVEEYQFLRKAHKELRAIDPSHPIEKVVRWSLHALEVLMQKEKWDEAAPVAEELPSLWDQVEKPEFIQKHAHTFSITLAIYIQKQSAEKVNLLMTHMNRSTATILQQFSSQSQQLLRISSANSALPNNLRIDKHNANDQLLIANEKLALELEASRKKCSELQYELESSKSTAKELQNELSDAENRCLELQMELARHDLLKR